MEFSVTPVGSNDVSMSKFVGLSAKICEKNHISHDVWRFSVFKLIFRFTLWVLFVKAH
jgi:hypothetical protein